MPRKQSKPKPAEIIEYQQMKTAAGGSGASSSGGNTVSLMGLLVGQRQSNLSQTLTSDQSNASEDKSDSES